MEQKYEMQRYGIINYCSLLKYTIAHRFSFWFCNSKRNKKD